VSVIFSPHIGHLTVKLILRGNKREFVLTTAIPGDQPFSFAKRFFMLGKNCFGVRGFASAFSSPRIVCSLLSLWRAIGWSSILKIDAVTRYSYSSLVFGTVENPVRKAQVRSAKCSAARVWRNRIVTHPFPAIRLAYLPAGAAGAGNSPPAPFLLALLR